MPGRPVSEKPRAVEGLEIHETEDGLVIYQEETDRVHHLNQTAAAVFYLCDGSRDIDELTSAIGELFGVTEGARTAVLGSLEQLEKEKLVS